MVNQIRKRDLNRRIKRTSLVVDMPDLADAWQRIQNPRDPNKIIRTRNTAPRGLTEELWHQVIEYTRYSSFPYEDAAYLFKAATLQLGITGCGILLRWDAQEPHNALLLAEEERMGILTLAPDQDHPYLIDGPAFNKLKIGPGFTLF